MKTHTESQKQVETLQKQIAKSMVMTKKLLVEKSDIDMKEARRKSMENRLRLGQFTTKRQGAQLWKRGKMDMHSLSLSSKSWIIPQLWKTSLWSHLRGLKLSSGLPV